LTIADSANGGWLGVDSDNFIINSTVPISFNLTQTSTPLFQEWDLPNIFLADVIYSINVAGSPGAVVQTISETNVTGAGPLQFQVLPGLWYTDCASGYSSTTTSSSLEIWSCSIEPTQCTVVTTGTIGWTNLPDCVNGVQYEYCPIGDFCGNSNCNGPCKVIYDDCINVSASNYHCVLDPKKYFSDTKWWESKIFIGIVSAIGLIIIALIIIIFVKIKHKIQVAGESEDNNTN